MGDMIDRLPATPSSKMRRTPSSTPGVPRREEKIFVTVRLRPLSRREQALYDLIAWECADDNTIVYKNPNQERGAASYVFGTVEVSIYVRGLYPCQNLIIKTFLVKELP